MMTLQEIKGYELCPVRSLGFTILCAVTACFPLVLISWKTEIKVGTFQSLSSLVSSSFPS